LDFITHGNFLGDPWLKLKYPWSKFWTNITMKD